MDARRGTLSSLTNWHKKRARLPAREVALFAFCKRQFIDNE
jgi:hypothetical protein